MLSLIAAGLYAVAVCAVICAAIIAHSWRQSSGHARGWLVLAVLFGGLVVMRLMDAEQLLAQDLRNWLRSAGAYADRRSLQGPLAAIILAIAAIAALGWFVRNARQARGQCAVALAAAQMAGMAMVCLIALRLVSFHPVDALLYGPLKLNWFADLGLTLIVVISALIYVRALWQRRRRSLGDAQR